MKQVLWISRHEMTPDQAADLERVLGDSVNITQWKDTVEDLTALQPLIAQSDVIAAVLPVGLLAHLVSLADGKPVLQSVSWRRPTGSSRMSPEGRMEPEFRFVHRCWQKILRLEFEAEDL